MLGILGVRVYSLALKGVSPVSSLKIDNVDAALPILKLLTESTVSVKYDSVKVELNKQSAITAIEPIVILTF